MTLVIIAILAGAVAGLARGGGFARLAMIRPVRNRLILTGLGLYAAGVMLALIWQPVLAYFAAAAMFFWAYYAWLNRSIQGALLVALGLAANAFVLLVNGATPVSADAADRAGAAFTEAVEPQLNEAAGADSTFGWLGKSVPVAFPPRPEVVSPGDLAIAAGLAVGVCMGMTGRRRTAPAAPAARPADPPDEAEQPDTADRPGEDEQPGEDDKGTVDDEPDTTHDDAPVTAGTSGRDAGVDVDTMPIRSRTPAG